jgi:hypothetical protein
MDETVRHHLANQRCIILRGQHLEGPEKFCKEEIEAARGPLNQPVEWHGKLKFISEYTAAQHRSQMRSYVRKLGSRSRAIFIATQR